MNQIIGCFVLMAIFPGIAGGVATGQEKAAAPAGPASTCSRESALEIVQRQIDLSKTIDNDVRRLQVLIKAADIIWPLEPEKARATFADAFEVATRNFKEKGAKDTSDGRMRVQGVDQRYTVITAIAKRDSKWAQRLSKQILEEEMREAADQATKDPAQMARTAEKLLNTATSLIATDQAAALAFARSSFAYPAVLQLPFFLFKLSEVNRSASDQLYVEALNVYAKAPMDQFLYLSSYPFAASRELGEMPVWTNYAPHSVLTPNPTLQRTFVSALLSRAAALIRNPASAAPQERFSETSQIYMALTRLESMIDGSLADLGPALAEAKGNISSLLTQPEQQRVGETLTDPPKQSFDERIENADRMADAARRESVIALAVISAAETESLEKLEAAAAKIDDVKLRSQIMSMVYFNRSQRALKDKKIEEARKYAAKVEEPDQRAYLFAQIANESLKQTKEDAAIRQMIEDVLEAVAKAPDSAVKVRAMLVIVHLYSAVDPNRAVSVLGDVVKTINRVEAIDLAGDVVRKKIEGRQFGMYRSLQTPGFSPENVFRSMSKLDFDGTLYVASNLTDKYLRAMTTLTIADQCLKNLPPSTKPKPNRPVPAKP
jgi:hypothetical protein